MDRQAFERLCEDALPRLRGVVRRMVGHKDQTDDLVQDALAKAWGGDRGFRRTFPVLDLALRDRREPRNRLPPR